MRRLCLGQSSSLLLVVLLLARGTFQGDAFATPPFGSTTTRRGVGASSIPPIFGDRIHPSESAQHVIHLSRTRQMRLAAKGDDGRMDEKNKNNIIDAIIEEEIAAIDAAAADTAAESAESSSSSEITPTAEATQRQRRKRDGIRNVLRRLADLSLRDYRWRSSLFKSTEADRQVEESLARMMGEANAPYLRPMDASDDQRGPLGKAEREVVTWLSGVIEEEGKRAQRICSAEGELVRPIDLEAAGEGGPLARSERRVVNFLDRIRRSERERATSRILRPKDVEEARRGPLGEAEARAVAGLAEIAAAERMRARLSQQRGGEVVRPIDVPGPLGEVERTVLEAMAAERQRAKERERNDGRCVRPKDAAIPGPLGAAEKKAMADLNLLRQEEQERLRNIQRVLQERRPAESDPDSALGLTERFTVGLLKGPRLLGKVAERVVELMSSSKLDKDDANLLQPSSDDSAVADKSSADNGGMSDDPAVDDTDRIDDERRP